MSGDPTLPANESRSEAPLTSIAEPPPKPKIIAVREGADGWGVTTIASPARDYQPEPCARCPWLTDSPVGAFPPEVFRHSAETTYDLATRTFGCHASSHDEPRTCAGFLLRGAAHNLTVRMHGPDIDDVTSDRPLYRNYRDMAIANGVDPDDPALEPCRDSINYALGETPTVGDR